MRKTVSLNKPQQSSTNNQKSITQFFKKASNNALAPVDSKAPSIQPLDHINKSLKRKLTPINSVTNSHKTSDNNEYSHKNVSDSNTPKKLKLQEDKCEPNQNRVKTHMKKSPKKENRIMKQKTPTKCYDVTKFISPQKVNDIKFNEINELELKHKRSPLSPVHLENHVKSLFKNEVSNTTPVKNNSHNHERKVSSEKNERSIKKSPMQEFICSPVKDLQTSRKTLKELLSPSKKGSTVKTLEFSEDFNEDWSLEDIDFECPNNLDLNVLQRCEIISVKRCVNKIELQLKNSNNNIGTCLIDGVWLNTPLTQGDIVSILAILNENNEYIVNNASGLIVLRPDHLISSTSVVAGVFCRRKAVLQERWKGIDSANTAMTIGVLVHELVQKALTNIIANTELLHVEADNIIKDSIQMLYDAGLSEEETRSNMQSYIQPLAQFMQTYVTKQKTSVMNDKENWRGQIDKVLDIEENLCCPQLGLKGKIDATLQVTIHDRKAAQKALVPLEIKSGKASVSAEHRGQLVLYGMMLSLQQNEDPMTSLQRGLLLYLKDRVNIREVSCGHPERRDLMMLRNELVQYLAASPDDCDPEQIPDIEDASILLQQKLPDPVHHENACSKCPYLTICSLHLWHTDGPSVSEIHPLSKLRDQALGHLSPNHIKYFLHWTALLKMEEKAQLSNSPLHSLWTDTPEKRAKRGTCAADLKLTSVSASEDRYLHRFMRQGIYNENNKSTKGPQEGDFSIVSLDNRPWIAAGVVILANNKELHILLERDLSRRFDKHTSFHIDTYESYATVVQNLTNLGVLMEDSDRAERLRKLIIDKAKPEFEIKLSREVGRLGTKFMRTLNIEQQRVVFKTLALKDYALLQGLPGTGKTQTISILIQMLVALKQRVLVTAHTHSAVDTVLSRLPKSIKIMRLGSSSRVAESLLACSEQALLAECKTSQDLERLYDSMEVVGVTCLGAGHAMLARTVFDICIVDEATQVLQCTVLRPLFAAKKFVLVGDPEQLPPVVRSRAARRLGMEVSLFHRLMSEESTSTLRLQYRMNQALVDVANRVAYNGRLKCADQKIASATLNIDMKNLINKPPWLEAACSPEPDKAAVFLNVNSYDSEDNINKMCINKVEACVVLTLVEVLNEGGVKFSDIGVIAPFRDQVAYLRDLLKKYAVEVSTVDQFQGKDKSVIIYSCTKQNGQDNQKAKEGEVLNDQRRLAVSVTRAKHKLLVIGNSQVLHRYAPLQRLIESCILVQLNQETVKGILEKYTKIMK